MATSPRGPRPAQLPAEFGDAVQSPLPSVRLAIVRELVALCSDGRPGTVLAVHDALTKLADDDSRRVATAARSALDAVAEQARAIGMGDKIRQQIEAVIMPIDNMDTAARVLSLAQQTSDQAIADARREAEETLGRARREADEVLTKARRQAGQITADARARAESLERDFLERHRHALGSIVTQREAIAQAVSEQTADYTARAGLGPWTQLADQARRLQVLGLMGEHERVLAETAALRTHMAGLPARRGPNETVAPWNARETILAAVRSSALATRDWQQCLDLNARIEASKRERGAGLHEVTRTRFNDTSPLIGLGRLSEASSLLDVCQEVFEEQADITMLAKVFTTRADLETELGHPQSAADLEQAALRLSYLRPEARDIAISHHNVANDLWNLGSDQAGQRAHRLAAALIFSLANMAHYRTDAVAELAAELRADSGGDAPPVTVAQVVATAEQVEGVHLAALLAALEPDPKAVEAALAEILGTAAALALDPGSPSTRP